MLLHTDAFAREAFTQGSSYTKKALHSEVLAHRHLYTEKLLHREILNSNFLRGDHFTQRSLYTKQLLHTETFTHRCFETQRLLQRDNISHGKKIPAEGRSSTYTFAFHHTFVSPRYDFRSCPRTNRIRISAHVWVPGSLQKVAHEQMQSHFNICLGVLHAQSPRKVFFGTNKICISPCLGVRHAQSRRGSRSEATPWLSGCPAVKRENIESSEVRALKEFRYK